jgi:outer membrane murein-binding lipoprotein Lpp
MKKANHQLYMVIDITTIEQTVIRFVAPRDAAIALGQIYMAEHPGRRCIAPPLEGRGFSKVDSQLQLQYLFWNTFAQKPSEDYATLVKDCLSYAEKMDVTETELSVLHGQLAALGGAVAKAERKEQKAAKDPAAPATDKPAAPKKTSTCGLVWDLCDKVLNESKLDLSSKELRSAIMAACEQEGVNKSTAAVQYGKWKASKNV